MQILVIDDTQSRLDWFQDVLEALGYDVRLASDADLALDQFRETVFDLAFFDHDMGPGMNGSQLAYHLLNNPEKFKIPKAVWIHTSNPVGVENIAAKFRSVGIPIRRRSFEACLQDKADFKDSVEALLR
jgi:CheY-like chemotaxis protein